MSSDKVRCADNQQAISGKISDEYFAGFVDGEGCFYVGFGRRKDLPLGWQIITEFHLSQNPGGKNILEDFKIRLNAGYIKPNHPKSQKDKTWVMIVKNRQEIKEKLLPFFEKHPLHSEKARQLNLFKNVLSIIENGEHIKFKGFKEIVDLVFQNPTNTKKKYSKEVLLTEASETIRLIPVKPGKI